MAQNNIVERALPRYTRTDFTSLRAWLSGISSERVATQYYTEIDLEMAGLSSPDELEQHLQKMRDHLIARASVRSPPLAEGLRNARKSARWSKIAMSYLFEAAEFTPGEPLPTDSLSAWLKPRVVRTLEAEGVRTLQELKTMIEQRGPSWWRPICRLGRGKAAALERWLSGQEKSLGALQLIDEPAEKEPITLHAEYPILVPLERISRVHELDGSQGINRAHDFSLIQARNDLEALQAFLIKYRAQPKTYLAYRKELERFLLWCIYKAKKPLSSVLADDCEHYKNFLEAPDPAWCGKRSKRYSVRWRPFEGSLSMESQRYVIKILKTFFKWLVDVRYLAGNPWVAVGNPITEKRQTLLRIDKAIPKEFWQRMVCDGGILDQACMLSPVEQQQQIRLARAAILLMGFTGLRREEAASARREHLKPVPAKAELWELEVLGKGRKWRTVFLPDRVISALEDHWEDRGEDFANGRGALIAPLVIPKTAAAQAKHGDLSAERKGYAGGALYNFIKLTLYRMADNRFLELDDFERDFLRGLRVHDLRHTFGTLAAGKEVPLDVLQRLLGHASLQTTSIYVQAERKRSIEEMAKFFA